MKPTIIKLSDATFVKTSNPVYQSFDDSSSDSYSELGGKRQSRVAARQAAKVERKVAKAQGKTAIAQARAETKTARKVGRVGARAAKKAVRVESRMQRRDTKVAGRIGRATQKQAFRRPDVGTGTSLGQPREDSYVSPEVAEQELMEVDAQQQFEQPQEQYQEQYENQPTDNGVVYEDELPMQEEGYYESEYEDESEDPESEEFAGFADEFDEAHYQATGKRLGQKMKFKRPRKIVKTIVNKDKIKNVDCAYNRIDLGSSGFAGSGNPLVPALVTLAAVGFAGFLMIKYVGK